MSSIAIRSLGPQDADILDRIRPGLIADALDPSQVWAFLATRINILVVALNQGEVVGMASGTTLMHPDKATEFLISNIVVHSDNRRHGIASKMMRRLIELAEDRGCARVWAQVQDDDVAFCALARSLGAHTKSSNVFEWQSAAT